MKTTVYLESTIISYATARPSRDLVIAAHQQITRDWFSLKSDKYDMFISQAVINEISAGDPEAAMERSRFSDKFHVLAVNHEVAGLAQALVDDGAVPDKAAIDAIHIAVATVHGIEYLMTWNCAHIANAVMRQSIEDSCRRAGYEPPVICTPEELTGDEAP